VNRNTSLFLDLLRVGAAMGVVFVHTGLTGFSRTVSVDQAFGLSFVVVFFVLSGYVISHSVDKRSMSARTYAIARLSRLYSVLIPALALTALLLVVGRSLNPAYYASFSRGREMLRFGLSTVYLQESWNLSAAPPTNSPLWSLAYEFWYYSLFGVLYFSRSRRFMVWAILGIAAIAGLKILLLLPAWAAGVASYRLTRRCRIGPMGVALVLLAGSAAAAVLLIITKVQYPWHTGYPPFYFSNAFVSAILLSLFVAAAIYAFDRVMEGASVPRMLGRVIRWCANMTFSLYLLHYPILVFAAATLPYDHSSRFAAIAILAAILMVIALISHFTEAKRQILSRWLDRILPQSPEPAGASEATALRQTAP
jgi:peptidoglycan/LPS O-acetylase OafA/YrhL